MPDIPEERSLVSATALVLGIDERGKLLSPSVEQTAQALLQMLHLVATEKASWYEKNADVAYAPNENDTEEDKAKKDFIRAKHEQELLMGDLKRIQAATNAAEVHHGVTMANHNGWVGADGTYHDISEVFADIRPSEEDLQSSGSARALESFISKTAPHLVERGIPVEEIASLNQEGKKRLLSYLNAWVNKIEKSQKPRAEKDKDLEYAVQAADKAESISQFEEDMKVYIDPGAEGVRKILYVHQQVGDVVTVVSEMDEDLWNFLYRPRLGDRMKEAPAGTLMPPINPNLVSDALGEGKWDGVGRKLMRAAVCSDPCRRIVLGIFEARPQEEVSIQDILAITSLSEQQVKRSVRELENLTTDGVNPHIVQKGSHTWKMNTIDS